jgi:hypothetical protein
LESFAPTAISNGEEHYDVAARLETDRSPIRVRSSFFKKVENVFKYILKKYLHYYHSSLQYQILYLLRASPTGAL